MICLSKDVPHIFDDRGGILLFSLIMMPFLILIAVFLSDLAAENIMQTRLHYALESALDAAATQEDPLAAEYNCIVLNQPGATQAFESGLLAALKSPGLTSGSGIWNFQPPAGTSDFSGPIQVNGFQVYNANELVQTGSGTSTTYSCQTLSPPLWTTTPWGTVVDRPSVYADLSAPVVLPTGRRVTIVVSDTVGANQ